MWHVHFLVSIFAARNCASTSNVVLVCDASIKPSSIQVYPLDSLYIYACLKGSIIVMQQITL